MFLRRKRQKEVFPCVCVCEGGGGVKMATQADSCQKQADLGQKRLLSRDFSRSHDKCGFGVKVAIFPQIPQQVV